MASTSTSLSNVSLLIYRSELLEANCKWVKHVRYNQSVLEKFLVDGDLDTTIDYCQLLKTLPVCLFWMTVALGLVGNLTALITTVTFPKSTGTFYICVLSASDLAAVLVKAIFYLSRKYIYRYRDYSDHWCKIEGLLPNYVITYANWVLVLICFERYVSVRFPLKKHIYFTKRKAYYSVMILALALFPFFCVYLFLYEANENGRCVTPGHLVDFFRNYWTHVATILYSFLPTAILLILVLLLALELRKIQNARKAMMNEGAATSRSLAKSKSERQQQNLARMEQSITVMLFFATIVFLILTLPICVVVITYSYSPDPHRTPMDDVRQKMIMMAAKSLAYFSHAVNFYVYFLSAKKFRDQLLCRSRHRRRNTETRSTMYTDVNRGQASQSF